MSSKKRVDLIAMYESSKDRYGMLAYKHLSELLASAKSEHKQSFTGWDHEQSWRAFKGKGLERLIKHIIKDAVEGLGLSIVAGGKLERVRESNLSEELSQVKRNLLVDYGQFGYHLPDLDLVIYQPELGRVLAVVSSKTTLRERISQTGYWSIKLKAQPLTKHIKVFFVTLDEDGTLSKRSPAKKGRAIAETDTDGSYVSSAASVEESRVVKNFENFFSDLKVLLGRG